MNFNEMLTEYCKKAGCTNNELAKVSGVDASLISRYKKGSRVPEENSDNIIKLSKALENIAKKKGISEFPSDIYSNLNGKLVEKQQNKEKQMQIFMENLDTLLTQLNISNISIAKYMNVDASYISRIRNGQRKPSDTMLFIQKLSDFLVKFYFKGDDKKLLEKLILNSSNKYISEKNIYNVLSSWMICDQNTKENSFTRFVNKLDEFDLNEYIEAIKFNDIKIPNVPVSLPVSKKYYGTEEMRIGTIEFIKSVVVNKQSETITMYSDIPMTELGKDIEFGKKWMFGLAMAIKKGIYLNCIHCLDRSFDELMLGLESWIPLYMTGQISPYYFKNRTNQIFCHHLFASEAAVLSGECMYGHEDEGMYYLTKKKEEIAYYAKKAEYMLESAYPLIKIFTMDNQEHYVEYREKTFLKSNKRKSILSSPAIYTMKEDFLNKILKYNNIDEETAVRVKEKIKTYKIQFFNQVSNEKIDVEDNINYLTKEQFKESPVVLHLAELFEEISISYSWELYNEHINSLEQFKKTTPGYNYNMVYEKGFKNIQIIVIGSEAVIVSKNNEPVINFIIEHPKLCEAFQNIVIPIRE